MTIAGRTHIFRVDGIPKELMSWSSNVNALLEEWEDGLESSPNPAIRNRHAEILAFAYAVLCGVPDFNSIGNINMCDNCHYVSLFISWSEQITIRHFDASKRVHIIQDGICHTCLLTLDWCGVVPRHQLHDGVPCERKEVKT